MTINLDKTYSPDELSNIVYEARELSNKAAEALLCPNGKHELYVAQMTSAYNRLRDIIENENYK